MVSVCIQGPSRGPQSLGCGLGRKKMVFQSQGSVPDIRGVWSGKPATQLKDGRMYTITALNVCCLVSQWAPGAHRCEALGGSPGLRRCWSMLFSASCWPFTSCFGVFTSQVRPQNQAACLTEDHWVKAAVGVFQPQETQSKGPSTVPRPS